MPVLFGPSGNSASFYEDGNKKTIQAPKWLSEKGLNAYEYSFGRGVNMSDETAVALKDEFDRYNIKISVHAPYYTNFANIDPAMIDKSIEHLIRSAKKVKLLGGNRVVFHPAALGKLARADAVKLCCDNLLRLTERIYAENLSDVFFCPETMGKINLIGTVEEIAKFCLMDKVFLPTIDFGHLYARSLGDIQGEEKYNEIVNYLLTELGSKATEFHVHFSKIEYSKGGEVRHLTFDSDCFGPDFDPLARVIKKYGIQPVIICESSGTQAEDSIKMKQIFDNIN